MAASLEEVNRWISTAKKEGNKFIISVCDTFNHDDYPVYCKDAQELALKSGRYDGTNMQRINEIINVDEYTEE